VIIFAWIFGFQLAIYLLLLGVCFLKKQLPFFTHSKVLHSHKSLILSREWEELKDKQVRVFPRDSKVVKPSFKLIKRVSLAILASFKGITVHPSYCWVRKNEHMDYSWFSKKKILLVLLFFGNFFIWLVLNNEKKQIIFSF